MREEDTHSPRKAGTLRQWGRKTLTHLERQGPYSSEGGRHSPRKAGTLRQWGRKTITHLERQGPYSSEGGRHSPTWNGRDSTAVREEDTHLERQGLYGSEAGRHSPTWNGRDPTAVREEGTHPERQGLYGSEGGRHSPTWNGRDSTAVREEDTWKGRDSTAVREEGTWKGRDSTAVREEGTHLDRLGPTPSHTVAMRVEATHLGRQGLYSSEGGRRSPGKAGTQRQCGRKTLTWKGRGRFPCSLSSFRTVASSSATLSSQKHGQHFTIFVQVKQERKMHWKKKTNRKLWSLAPKNKTQKTINPAVTETFNPVHKTSFKCPRYSEEFCQGKLFPLLWGV